MTAGEKSIRPPPGAGAGEQVRLPLRSPFSMGVVACVGFEWPARCWRSRWPGAWCSPRAVVTTMTTRPRRDRRRRRLWRPRTCAPVTPPSPPGWPTIKATSAADRDDGRGRRGTGRKTLNDTIEPAWQPIEGTIKANDPDTYITFEDNFAVLGDAIDSDDAAKAQAGGRRRSRRPPTRTWRSTRVTSDARRARSPLLGTSVGPRHVGVGARPRATRAGRAERRRCRSDEAIRQLDIVRESIDRTLALIKAGQRDQAFAEAKAGYLSHFEYVEIPLRVVDAAADLRRRDEVRRDPRPDQLRRVDRRDPIEHRRAARRSSTTPNATSPTPGSARPRSCSASRSSSSSAKGSKRSCSSRCCSATSRRPRRRSTGDRSCGAWASAALATVATFFVLRTVLSTRCPSGGRSSKRSPRSLAVAVLFYVSFWLIARLEQKRWLEFLRARVWSAVSVGSTAALVLVGFTAVYREGFETALFYQALAVVRPRARACRSRPGLVAGHRRARRGRRASSSGSGRRVPLKAFLSTAVVLLMATSVAFLGNAVRSLQEADVIALHRWPGWPRAPIFLSQSLGYWPSRETITAQLGAHHGLRARRVVHVRAASAVAPFDTHACGGAGDGAAGVPADAGRRVGRLASLSRDDSGRRRRRRDVHESHRVRHRARRRRRRRDRADDARPRRRRRGRRRRRRRPARAGGRRRPHRARHPLDDPSRQRAARGRRRHASA